MKIWGKIKKDVDYLDFDELDEKCVIIFRRKRQRRRGFDIFKYYEENVYCEVELKKEELVFCKE